MPVVVDRATLKTYCLQNLGEPVIKVNVADEQVENRIDDALQRMHEKHYDGTEEAWLAYKITQADLDNGYLTISDDILTVVEVLRMGDINQGGGEPMFSYQYQFALQNLSPFQMLDMINYYMVSTNIDMASNLVNSAPRVEHTRYMNKVMLYNNLEDFSVDSVVALRVFRVIDPETYPRLYNDIWLKKYATALIKLQWGNNLKKHDGVELLGGVKINGQQMFDEATTEIQSLEEELERTYMEPVDFFF